MKTSRKTCARKAQFSSPKAAEHFARSRGWPEQTAYRCNRCKLFHLTSPNKHPADRARHAVYLASRKD